MFERAIINARLGDGHFWQHPRDTNACLVYTSIHEDWLRWKQQNLLVSGQSAIACTRKANAKGCYPNAKPLYTLKSYGHAEITQAKQGYTRELALTHMDLLDLAIWYIDDGCCHIRKDGPGLRIFLCVGALAKEQLFPQIQRLFGTSLLGRVIKNNSKATENNKSWVIPKPIAVQIMARAHEIAPECLQYKTPQW